MTLNILAISGSPAENSSSGRLADHVLSQLTGAQTSHLRLSTLDPAALLRADTAHPDIIAATGAVERAHGLVIVTPIYKAAYSGLLKTFLDLLGQFALSGKSVLPLATGGSLAHALALDYALRPVLHSMGARHVIQGLVLLPGQIDNDARAQSMLDAAVDHFIAATTTDPLSRNHGHPEPARLA